MTTTILVLVMCSIIGSIGVMSLSIYLNLRERSLAESKVQQETNIGVAATILERRISGSVLTWAEDGTIGEFQSWAIPPFYDSEIIDSVTRVTKQDAGIFAINNETRVLEMKTTSLVGADGARQLSETLVPGSEVYESLIAGAPYLGTVEMMGMPYFASLQPIKKANGETMGAIFVGTPMAHVEEAANSVLGLIALVGGGVTIGLGLIGFIISRAITKPIPRLASAMDAIAQGKYDTEVPYADWGNEVGGMARAVEVFRQNGERVAQMTEAEAARIIADQENRKQMMAQLQAAFGQVVDAAIAGDFNRRVETEFPDEELNSLAAGINRLVSNFERGVTEMLSVLGAMAHTDLTQRMTGEYEGAFARLKEDTNAMADRFTEVVTQLRQTSGALKTATNEILSGANDLSERTTKQAATIEETAAAMEQLAATVLKNAERAHEASTNAQAVTGAAEQGVEVMDSANKAMERISASSGKISNIIGLIDDIAFQTNLLALNASVEAARAGEAGKGFAVVAVEVRRLAQSAAQASSEVKALIEQSAGEVSNGTKLVESAAAKIAGMLVAIRENTSSLEAIAQDSREQAASIEEVSAAVHLMDEMTQHNAALVEETNAAIEQTEAQAIELDRIVETFKVASSEDVDWASVARQQRERPRPSRSERPAFRGNAAVEQDWEAF